MLYAIIINYNGQKDTVACIDSLKRYIQENRCRIIIVDNSCDDFEFNSLVGCLVSYTPTILNETILENFDINAPITAIQSHSNNGFAAANNIAIRLLHKNIGSNDRIWFLNNDTVLIDNAFEEIESYIAINKPDFLGTSLYEYRNPRIIQSFYGTYLLPFGHYKLINKKNSFDLLKSLRIKYPNGASFIVSASFVKTIGFFNEKYFLYFEELDLVLRARKHGIKPVFIDCNKILHKGGVSTGGFSRLAQFHSLKSQLIFHKLYSKSLIPYLFITVRQLLLFLVRKNKLRYSDYKSILSNITK